VKTRPAGFGREKPTFGKPKLSSTDDIVNMLEAMVKKYPKAENGKKTYGVSLYKDWDYFNMNGCTGLGLLYGWSTRNFVEYNNDATQVRSILDKDSYYMKCLRFYYECNKRGLLDPDSPTQNYATVTDKYGKGQILLGFWAYCGLAQYNTKAHTDAGKGFYMIPVEGEKIVSNGFNPYGAGEAAGIGSATKNPVRAMKVLNWLYSPEGVEAINNGPEGLCWTVKDGKNVSTDFAKNLVGETKIPDEYGGGTWSAGHLNNINWWAVNASDTDPNTNEPYNSGLWSSSQAQPQSKLYEDWSKDYGYRNSMELAEARNEIAVIPGNDFVPANESDALKTKENQIATVIKTNCWKMAFAKSDEEFESLYKDMVTKAKGLGLDEVLDFYIKDTQNLAKAIQESVKG
jgi:putative aldouronate transport system substrate-binding protein